LDELSREIKIGICEDNKKDASFLFRLIQKYSRAAVDWYSSAEKLLRAYANDKRYDLIFMDIQMPGVNGFDAAKAIHHDYYDERPLIVFLTITDNYVFEAYNIGWDYVCKPIDETRVRQIYIKAQAEISHRRIPMQTKEGLLYLESRDIVYIEAFYGLVKVVTRQGIHQNHTTLDKFQELLGNRPFCRIHRCYIVNLRHVTGFTQTDINLSSGMTVPLSRRQKKPFVECLENYHRGMYYG